jgi:predicted transglutaminase-like cysteine proteinase
MKVKTALGAAIIGLFCGTSIATVASAAANSSAGQSRKFSAVEFGKTLPPVGYVKFCAKNPNECLPKGGSVFRLAMSTERWKLVHQVNAYVNGKIAPVSDQDLYGEPEHWAYPTDAGDCEDYLLLKKRLLETLDFAPETLLITVVLDEKGEGHAVLTVATDDGDFVLDNRRNEVLQWSDTNYKFLKRQSHADPRQWVALVKQVVSTSGSVSTGKAD